MLLCGKPSLNRLHIIPATVYCQDQYYDLSLAPAIFWSTVRSDGGNIRVWKQDVITPLAREIAGWDYAGHKGGLWIANGGATSYYLTYDNPALVEPAPTSPYGARSVWESAIQLLCHWDGNTDDFTTNNTISGTPSGYVTGRVAGQAAHFTGVSHCDANHDLASTVISVVCWIDPAPANNAGIVASGPTDTEPRFALTLANQTLEIFRGNEVDSPKPVALNAWTFVVITNDGVQTRAYVNAAYDSWAQGISKPLQSSFHLGYDYWGNIIANIDELRVYNRILSPNEVAEMYACQGSPATFWTTMLG